MKSYEIPSKANAESMTNSCGVFFIAFGKKYVEEAIFCAESIRKVSNISIAIHCDVISDNADSLFDHVTIIKPDHARAKVDYLENSPFNNTLYMDSDTMIKEDISFIFSILDKYDIAMTHDYARKRHRWCELLPEYKNIPDGFSEFGGGIILYKMPKCKEFLELWKNYFYKYFKQTHGWDQASLRIASWKTSCNIYVLPPEYNVRSRANRNKVESVWKREGGEYPLRPRILHWHGLNDSTCDTEPFKY